MKNITINGDGHDFVRPEKRIAASSSGTRINASAKPTVAINNLTICQTPSGKMAAGGVQHGRRRRRRRRRWPRRRALGAGRRQCDQRPMSFFRTAKRKVAMAAGCPIVLFPAGAAEAAAILDRKGGRRLGYGGHGGLGGGGDGGDNRRGRSRGQADSAAAAAAKAASENTPGAPAGFGGGGGGNAGIQWSSSRMRKAVSAAPTPMVETAAAARAGRGHLRAAGRHAHSGRIAQRLREYSRRRADPGGGTPGKAFGSGLFLQGNGSLALAPGAGQTQTISDVIADQTGVGGTGANAGSWRLVKNGAGTTILTGANAYSGATLVNGGTLVGCRAVSRSPAPHAERRHVGRHRGTVSSTTPSRWDRRAGLVSMRRQGQSVAGRRGERRTVGQVRSRRSHPHRAQHVFWSHPRQRRDAAAWLVERPPRCERRHAERRRCSV